MLGLKVPRAEDKNVPGINFHIFSKLLCRIFMCGCGLTIICMKVEFNGNYDEEKCLLIIFICTTLKLYFS